MTSWQRKWPHNRRASPHWRRKTRSFARRLEVYEAGAGASDAAFGYGLVARRKDPFGSRLDRVDVPARRTDLNPAVPDRVILPDTTVRPPGRVTDGRPGAPRVGPDD